MSAAQKSKVVSQSLPGLLPSIPASPLMAELVARAETDGKLAAAWRAVAEALAELRKVDGKRLSQKEQAALTKARACLSTAMSSVQAAEPKWLNAEPEYAEEENGGGEEPEDGAPDLSGSPAQARAAAKRESVCGARPEADTDVAQGARCTFAAGHEGYHQDTEKSTRMKPVLWLRADAKEENEAEERREAAERAAMRCTFTAEQGRCIRLNKADGATHKGSHAFEKAAPDDDDAAEPAVCGVFRETERGSATCIRNPGHEGNHAGGGERWASEARPAKCGERHPHSDTLTCTLKAGHASAHHDGVTKGDTRYWPKENAAHHRCAKCSKVAVYRAGAQCAACNAGDGPKPSAQLVSSASAMAATLKGHLALLRRLEAGDPLGDEEITAARELCESVLLAAGVSA